MPLEDQPEEPPELDETPLLPPELEVAPLDDDDDEPHSPLFGSQSGTGAGRPLIATSPPSTRATHTRPGLHLFSALHACPSSARPL